MINKLAPQKGKDFKNLPTKELNTFNSKTYLQSIKYDGNQIFIVKYGRSVYFYTSDWKQFNIDLVREELYLKEGNFILIGEYMYDSLGKLGDRRKSAKLTTFRTNFSKGLPNNVIDEAKTNIKIFDCLELSGVQPITRVKASKRLQNAASITQDLTYLFTVITTEVIGQKARENNTDLIRRGWEGSMLIDPDSYYETGKRVNHAIKLKGRLSADLLCIGYEEGEGKYEGLIGSLILTDSVGRIVKVGSGLDDIARVRTSDFYIGKVIEIEYEQILDTYIQPTFKYVRLDKTKEDIS